MVLVPFELMATERTGAEGNGGATLATATRAA